MQGKNRSGSGEGEGREEPPPFCDPSHDEEGERRKRAEMKTNRWDGKKERNQKEGVLVLTGDVVGKERTCFCKDKNTRLKRADFNHPYSLPSFYVL